SGQGTFLGGGINSEGYTSGYYVDANNGNHGFLRTPEGTIKKFDVPGATWTYGFTIDSKHAVGGQYSDSSGVYHGFVRHPDGTFTKFNAPGAGKKGGQGTNNVWSSNPAG